MNAKKTNDSTTDQGSGSGDSSIDPAAWEQFGNAPSAADETEGQGTGDLQSQLQEAHDKALRYQAELENFRRRARRDMDEQLKYACLPLIQELLDVQDNLQRALDAVAGTDSSGLTQGVQMVSAQLTSLLSHRGCQKIDTEGCVFDPNSHQAAQMVFSTEVPANHIIGELRAGYRLHDRVIRPAQVIISKGEQSDANL